MHRPLKPSRVPLQIETTRESPQKRIQSLSENHLGNSSRPSEQSGVGLKRPVLRRSQPHRSLQRQNQRLPTQPRWEPASQRCTTPGGRCPNQPEASRDHGLPRKADR